VAELGESNLELLRCWERVLTEGFGRRIALVAYQQDSPDERRK
jgi:hypothetical protein